MIDKLEAAKGSDEYRIGEIFLSANSGQSRRSARPTPTRSSPRSSRARSFAGYARQYSEASTSAVGGDLGWVRPEQLPEAIGTVVRQMAPNTLSAPIAVPGGFSIVALLDKRKVLTADPRAAVLNLKQVSIKIPGGHARCPRPMRWSRASPPRRRSIGGCGGAEKLAADFKGEVVQSDQVALQGASRRACRT